MAAQGADPRDLLEGARVLLVEDAGLIGMWAQTVLEATGIRVLGPVAKLSQALHVAESESFDIAFLDIDLDGEFVWPVADVLRNGGVPFAFTTGFERANVLPNRFLDAPTLSKPYREEELVSLARRLLAGRKR